MRTLAGQSALVTGTSRGIGPVIARALAGAGVRLALTARDRTGLERVAAGLGAPEGTTHAIIPADLRHQMQRERLVAEAEQRLGGIDILVNNAAIESAGAFLSADAATLAETIETNLTAPVQLTRLVLPGMLARGRGHVVSLASLAGKKGTPYNAVYSATKAGLIEWTHALRIELGTEPISLSVICPGYVTTVGMFARFGIVAPRSLGSCTPEQVADAVLRAVRHDRAELIVNSMPVRPLLALNALWPGLGDRWMTRLGITAFQQRKVTGRSAPHPPDTESGDAR